MENIANAMRDMGRAQGQLRREKAIASAMKRKEEYLGARVSVELRQKVIQRANNMGIPVSILIRNILEAAFSANSSSAVSEDSSLSEADVQADHTAAINKFPNVIAWESITLNRDMACNACSGNIDAGKRVTLGMTSAAEDHVILCGNCKESG